MAGASDRVPAAWASWINVVLGVWMIISPFVLRFAASSAALDWNSITFGILIVIASLAAISSLSPGPSWLNVVFGIWLITAPFILGFGAITAATTNSVVVGIVVGVLALAAVLAKSPAARERAPGV
ncbi:MAG: SPW repeat protein [Armatimonadetes bacterium]|nr:SPW repeat protein [Armatimonadota bacterium]